VARATPPSGRGLIHQQGDQLVGVGEVVGEPVVRGRLVGTGAGQEGGAQARRLRAPQVPGVLDDTLGSTSENES